jgi:hypothetical protein
MRSVSKAFAATLAAALLGGLASLAPREAAADPSPLDPAVVYNEGEAETPRTAGMGGTGRALAYGTSAVFLNPAALPEVRLYHIEGITSITPETRRWLLGASIVDSVTSRLAGAFTMVGTPIAMDPDGLNRSYLDLRLALGFPITERFSIGVSGRYLKATQSGVGPFGLSAASGGLEDPSSFGANSNGLPNRFALVNAVTWDAGIVIRPVDSILIAAVGQNLTYAKNGFLPMLAGGGVGYAADALSIEVDGLADIGSYENCSAASGTAACSQKATARIHAGAEYVIVGHVPVRLGYRFDQGPKLNTLSFGSGFIGDAFSVEASFKRTLSSPGATTIFLSFAYFLESTGLTRPTTGEPVSAQVAQ